MEKEQNDVSISECVFDADGVIAQISTSNTLVFSRWGTDPSNINYLEFTASSDRTAQIAQVLASNELASPRWRVDPSNTICGLNPQQTSNYLIFINGGFAGRWDETENNFKSQLCYNNFTFATPHDVAAIEDMKGLP